MLVLCFETNKVLKTLKLRMDEQLYDIVLVREEWRANLDQWLLDGAWLEDTLTESESESDSKSSSPKIGDVDHEMFNAEICGKDYGSIEEELLQKEGDTNSEGRGVTVLARSERDGEDGPFSIGPVPCSEDGLEFELGLADKLSHGDVKDYKAKSVIEEKPNAQNESEIKDSKGKKSIRESYLGDMAGHREEDQQWVTARIKEQWQRKEKE
ncbi:hypothetical protein SLE2022_049630 [Rubroshorea leprosula]